MFATGGRVHEMRSVRMESMDDRPPDARAVAAAFSLTGDVGEFVPVGGAWSNRVFRLDVGGALYVVKEMRNPWNIGCWREWLEQAWTFEQRAIAAGVLAPTPVPAPDGGCLAEVARRGDGACEVRVHRWVDGVPAPLGPATEQLAAWAGATLATLHALRVTPTDRDIFPRPNTDNADRWSELIEHARVADVAWAPAAAAVAGTVSDIAALVVEAGDGLDEEVMTHGDVDQKNVLLADGRPVLCDWDVAAPLVPRREVADVALSFGVWERFDIAREVIEAYRKAGGDLERLTPHDIAQPLMIGIDWIVLNIERALRLRPCSDSEANLGDALVPELLERLRRSTAIAHDIERILTPT